MNVLTQALFEAAGGGAGEVRRFYEELLRATVWVPIDDRGVRRKARDESSFFEQMNLLVVQHQGRKIIPIFSEEDFSAAWANGAQATEAKTLVSLIRVLPPEVWLYLNPGQECGKELSPWELGILASGEQAIGELLEELFEEQKHELEILPETPQFSPEVDSRVRQILESYSDVREAFRVLVKQPGEERFSAMIGVVDLPTEAEKERALREEIIEVLQIDGVDAEVVSGGAEMNRAIFEGRTPFYIRQQPLPRVGSPLPWWRRLFASK